MPLSFETHLLPLALAELRYVAFLLRPSHG